MKISTEDLFELSKNNFMVIHYFIHYDYCTYQCLSREDSDIRKILIMDEKEIRESIDRLMDIGYLCSFNGVIMGNQLELL
jgi:hypothetical protein